MPQNLAVVVSQEDISGEGLQRFELVRANFKVSIEKSLAYETRYVLFPRGMLTRRKSLSFHLFKTISSNTLGHRLHVPVLLKGSSLDAIEVLSDKPNHFS